MTAKFAALIGVSLAALCGAQPAAAQMTGAAPTVEPIQTETGRTLYPAAFFLGFNPANAQEMLQRLPGFTLAGGDSDVRGFAGAGGNVLIDGVRPASKSISLQDLLRRIPVKSVERIELIRAGDPTIDLQGQPMVANVVRVAGAGSSVAVTVAAKRFSDGWLAPRFAVEASKPMGKLLLEGAVRGNYDLDAESGSGRRRTVTPAGVVLRDNPLFSRERGGTLSANGSATLRRADDTLRLNAAGETGSERTIDLLPPQRSTQLRTFRSAEIGGDYERTFKEGLSGKVVALQTLGRNISNETSANGASLDTAHSGETSGESILRGSLTWRPSSALSLEAGGEGAFNWLESDVAVTANGRPVSLPNDNVRIEERRAEAFATATWTVSDRLSIDGGLRIEASKLAQAGDSTLKRDFFFAKPRLNVTYAPTAKSHVRLRLERVVGQLDFGDFAASTDLNLGVATGGNARLAPERSWLVEAAFEQRFWDAGAIVLTVTHEWVQQVVDRLPLGPAIDGRGNIGDGRRDQAKLTIALPLDNLGLKGARISGEGLVRRSRVTDPFSGHSRRISGQGHYAGNFIFSHDLARLTSTWGVEADLGGVETAYRIDEVRREKTEPTFIAFWDYKPRPDLSVKLEIENFTGRSFVRRRTLYAGPRGAGVVSAIETRDHKLDPFVTLRVRKVF